MLFGRPPVSALLLTAVLATGIDGVARAQSADGIDTANAKRHFRKGTELYMVGHYPEALAEFQAAQISKPLPAFNFNIARCFDRLERLDEAVKAYQAYLDAGPVPEDVPEVKERISALRARVAALSKIRVAPAPSPKPVVAKTPPPQPTPPQATPPSPTATAPTGPRAAPPPATEAPWKPRPRIATWVFTALTAGLALGAIYPTVHYYGLYNSEKNSGCGATNSCDTGSIKRVGYWAEGLWISAGVMLAATIIAAVFETDEPPPNRKVTVSAGPGGFQLVF